MKNNRVIFPLIIFLLIIFLPLTGYAVYYKYNLAKENGNPEHKHKFDNKLYYYDSSNKLIGMYSCQSNICDDAVTTIDDKDNLYYTKGNKNTLGVYNNNYVFINDNNIIKLYNLTSNISILNLNLIKNYGTTINGNYLIVKDTDNLYGLLDLNNISVKINRTYEYLAIKDNYSDGNLQIDSIIAKKDGVYYLIDINEKKLTSDFANPIYDYNDKIIICRNDNYSIYYYNGEAILNYQTIEKINVLNSSVIFQNSAGNVYIYNNDFSEIIKSYTVQSNDDKLTYEINDEKIEIKNNGVLIDTRKI